MTELEKQKSKAADAANKAELLSYAYTQVNYAVEADVLANIEKDKYIKYLEAENAKLRTTELEKLKEKAKVAIAAANADKANADLGSDAIDAIYAAGMAGA